LVALVALMLALVSFLRLRALTRPFGAIKEKAAGDSDYLPSLVAALDSNRRSVEELAEGLAETAHQARSSFRYVGLVRYDAFEDVGGKQSYSLCLLDGHRNGFLITYLTGRNSTRSYAVGIRKGEHSRKLSEEEMRAYEEACMGIDGRDSP